MFRFQVPIGDRLRKNDFTGSSCETFAREVQRILTEHFVRSVGEVGAGAEDRLDARGAKFGIILRGDDTARADALSSLAAECACGPSAERSAP